ncbi:hypothetical protein E3P99_03094 [Wallemia hederae]|uniref:Amine oxidase domain-containing protein n=1 Tax=Wallemia hederae TaxID=1540922 RepID=A0A4T0FLG7_9BASI|nr:hypothetical protein E3P99_03094 [Wallemia hederae]
MPFRAFSIACLAHTLTHISAHTTYDTPPQLSDFDSLGVWFDGVMGIDDGLNIEPSQVKPNDTRIAIVGAGISGLMTALLLDSVGLSNWEILEASDRVGGRIETVYVEGTSPDDRQYQEMGAMRLPQYWKNDEGELLPIKDQHLVNQLADTLNTLNDGEDGDYHINFIPWIDSTENNFRDSNDRRLPDGSIPRVSDVKGSERLSDPLTNDKEFNNEAISQTAHHADMQYTNAITLNGTLPQLIADNIFLAHKLMIEAGLDDTNQYSLFKALGYNATTYEEVMKYDIEGIWYRVFIDSAYDNAYNWTTVDKGFSRLTEAFIPLVRDSLHYHSRVDAVRLEGDSRVTLEWRDELMHNRVSDTYDYAIISAPFSVVQSWHLPKFSSGLMNRAIRELHYGSACKTALQFSRRFWEEGEHAMGGGCDTTDAFYGIETACYPPSTENSVVLSSYAVSDAATRLVSWPRHRLIEQALKSLARSHGDVVFDTYTGENMYKCWLTDQNAAGAWAEPRQGQHTLFMPEFHKTHGGVVFVGEHTSVTHAWVSSAVMSAVRGVVQVLLDMGRVREAKLVTREWMWRWLEE